MKRTFLLALFLILAPGLLRAADTRTWMISTFSWVKRIPAERGAPVNSQPLRVEAAVLERALGSVRLVSGPNEEPLFDPAEASDLAKAMAEALSLARLDEDLQLLSTAKRGRFVLGDSLAVTARVFVEDGKLNLIVHDARKDFMVEYRQETRLPEFEYGSRAAAGGVLLQAPQAEVRRADWIILPLTPQAAASPLPAVRPAAEVHASAAPMAQPQPVAGSVPAVAVSPGGSYTVQANDRVIVFSSVDSTLTVPDPGGANANRVLVILVPEYSNRLTIQCSAGSKLKHTLDGFAASGSSCLFAASGTAPHLSGAITCVSDGSHWYCK
jgi:hypothetical protein